MKFNAEGQELAKCLKSLDHFFVTEGQNNFWKQIFLNLFLEVSLTHQNNYDSTWNRPDLKSYMKTQISLILNAHANFYHFSLLECKCDKATEKNCDKVTGKCGDCKTGFFGEFCDTGNY